MNNQPNDIADLREEMDEVKYRLSRIESFLTSFEAGPAPLGVLDERFMEVLELLKDERKVTASMLQRHLDIGFVRSCRILDQMEFVGLISPSGNPTKPRDVYCDKIRAYLEEIK